MLGFVTYVLCDWFDFPCFRSDPVKRRSRRFSNGRRRSSSASPKNITKTLNKKASISETDVDKVRGKHRHKRSLASRCKALKDERKDDFGEMKGMWKGFQATCVIVCCTRVIILIIFRTHDVTN